MIILSLIQIKLLNRNLSNSCVITVCANIKGRFLLVSLGPIEPAVLIFTYRLTPTLISTYYVAKIALH